MRILVPLLILMSMAGCGQRSQSESFESIRRLVCEGRHAEAIPRLEAYKGRHQSRAGLFLGKAHLGLGDLDQARQAIEYFRNETEKAGFPGLHLQTVVFDTPNEDLLHKIDVLSSNSVTYYNWGGPHPEDYIQWGREALERREKWDKAISIPFFPNASIGWDDSPRFPHQTKKDIVHLNNTPEAFAYFLDKARRYCDQHPGQKKLITVFSWNEWIEGGYLLPDAKYGFDYLNKVKEVSSGSYKKY